MTIQRIEAGPRMSKVVIHGDTVYLAGLTANKTVGQSLAEQSAEILSLIDGFLAKAGTDKTKLLTATIWLSDIHVFSGNTPGMPYLPWVMSKFLGLGFSLEQVVAMATINPAKIINRAPKLGTLQVGAPGDVAVMELVEGPVEFVDTREHRRQGRAFLKPVQTVTGGVPFGRPYNAPFAVR